MSCYQCGSPQGASFKLCPDCIARNRQSREGALAALRTPTVKEDPVSKVIHNNKLKAIVALSLSALLFLVLLFKGPLPNEGLAASLLLALALSCTFFSVLCYYLFWLEVLVNNVLLAIIAFFVPFVVYGYVLRSEQGYKVLLILHIVFGALSFALIAGLSRYLDVGLLDLTDLISAWLHGKPISLEALRQQRYYYGE